MAHSEGGERPPVTNVDFAPGRWRARWIWFEPPRLTMEFPIGGTPVQADRFALFRRTFDLGEIPDRAPARATADARYVLWVNNLEAARGPIRCNGRRLHYDLVDLAPYLREGRNCIAVLARFYGRPVPWWAPTPGSLQLGSGSLVFEARVGEHWVVSNRRWRTLAGNAWRTDGRGPGDPFPPEILDARALPAGWKQPGFDDRAWEEAVEISAKHFGCSGNVEPPSHPYGPLLPRLIPQLRGEHRRPRAVRWFETPGVRHATPFDQVVADLGAATGAPGDDDVAGMLHVACAADRARVAVFDFGEVVSGGVEVNLSAPPATQVDMAFFESATPDGLPSSSGERTAVRYVTRGSEDQFESFDSFGLRYLGMSIRGVGPVTVEAVGVHERLYPREPGPSFQCSDPRLDRIWTVGRRTVDLNSHDAYLDCPTREQRAWTGDAVVHQMVDLATNPDWRLARWNVELGASPRADGMLPMAVGGGAEYADLIYIPDWSLHWVRSLHNLYRYTGDRDLVARLLPVAERVLRWFTPFLGPDGLLRDVTGWLLIDWSSVRGDGRSSILNGLYGRALIDFAEMSDWLDDAGRGVWAREIHAALRQGFEQFWDPGRAVYVDNLGLRDRGPTASQHGQAAAIVGLLAPVERYPRLVEVLVDRARLVHAAWSRASGDARSTAPGAAAMSFLLDGPPQPWWDVERQIVAAQPFFRYVVHDALALAGRADLIPDQCLDWEALLQRCATSWSETWYGGTVCHAWSATPTRDLSTRTLGVTPDTPGFDRARIAPRLGALEWANGAVPTPAGLIEIAITKTRVEVSSPVPFVLDLGGGHLKPYAAGKHAVAYP